MRESHATGQEQRHNVVLRDPPDEWSPKYCTILQRIFESRLQLSFIQQWQDKAME